MNKVTHTAKMIKAATNVNKEFIKKKSHQSVRLCLINKHPCESKK